MSDPTKTRQCERCDTLIGVGEHYFMPDVADFRLCARCKTGLAEAMRAYVHCPRGQRDTDPLGTTCGQGAH